MMDEYEKEFHYWNEKPFFEYLNKEMRRRSGITPDTLTYHQGELIYRYEERKTLGKFFEQAHYSEILTLIRMSGPLNRPMSAKDHSRAITFILLRDLDRIKRLAANADAAFERNFGPPDDPSDSYKAFVTDLSKNIK